MTDKENIIDVSKCEFFGIRTSEGKQFGWCHNYDEHCEDYPNCYFKQLKHKEQECEELKQWKKDAENLFRTQTDNADKIINRYKQVLDEIENLSTNAFCLINGTNKDMSNFAKQIINIINKAKEK